MIGLMKIAALLFITLLPLGRQDKNAASFATWWKQFQTAVSRRDAASVTKGARFPMQWENGPTRDVKAPSDFAARFDFYFTSEIKDVIAKRSPVAEGRESRTITWKARGNEYSLYFKPKGATWVFDGLSEGPP
jgi:hypothetical protein